MLVRVTPTPLPPNPCPISFWGKYQTSYCFKVRSFQLEHNYFSVYMTWIFLLRISCLFAWKFEQQVGLAWGKCLISILNRYNNTSTLVNSGWHFNLIMAFKARELWPCPSFSLHVEPWWLSVDLPLDTMGHSSMACNIQLFIPRCCSKPWLC